MKKSRKILSLFCAVCLVFGLFLTPTQTYAASNQEMTVTTTASVSKIYDNEAATMELAVTGKKLTGVVVPNDIVLVMDCSGSMATEGKFAQMQNAAKTFIDLMDLSKHRIGLVRYSDGVTSFDITDDADALKNWVSSMSMGGATNTDKGIKQAETMLNQQKRANAGSTIVLLSDGEATNQSAAKAAADTAKDPNGSNITIFTVALLNNSVASDAEQAQKSGANQSMIQIATSEAHHHYVGAQNVVGVYEQIASQIGEANIKDVTITQEIAPQFELVPGSADQSIPQPTISGNTMTWKINDLREETVHLQYQLRAKAGTASGTYSHISSGKITYLTYDGITKELSVPVQQLSVYYTPTITSVTPTDCAAAGGEKVVVKGSGFEAGTTVQVGTTKMSNVNIIDSQTLEFTTTALKQGTYNLTISNPGGKTATAQVRFMADPSVSSVTPASGPYAGGTKVAIKGQNFMSGAKVTFDGVEAQLSTSYTNSITAISPALGKEGPVDIVVTNPDGTTITIPNGFTYDPQPEPEKIKITGITPATGPEGKATEVSIAGSLIEKGATAQIGGADVTDLSVYSYKIVGKAPTTLPAGTYDVVVTNPDGTQATLPGAFTYEAVAPDPDPTITSVTPNSGTEGEGVKLSIAGANFRSGLTVQVGGVDATIVTQYAASISAKVPTTLAPGAYDVTVINSDGTTATAAGAYTVEAKVPDPLTITSVTPDSTTVGKTVQVSVFGTNIEKGATLQIGGKDATNLDVYTYKIKGDVPTDLPEGTYDVTITNPDGTTATLPGAFTYNAIDPTTLPTITEVTPASGTEGESVKISIKGTNFRTGLTVQVGGVDATISTQYAASISAKVPTTLAPGVYDVTVINSDGTTATAAGAYTVEAKVADPITITSVTPNSTTVGKTVQISVLGTNIEKGATLQIGGKEATNLDVYTYKIKGNVPTDLAAGTYDVTITNPDGRTATLPGAFTYDAIDPNTLPTITSLSVTSGQEGVATKTTIKGARFVPNGVKVYVGDTEATISTKYANSITIKVPTTLPAGTYDVTVKNADGGSVTKANAFTYTAKPAQPAPTISSISTTSGKVGVATKTSIKGANFVPAGVKVYVGNVEATISTKYKNAITIKVPTTLPAGTYDITVVNADGQQVTKANAYTYK